MLLSLLLLRPVLAKLNVLKNPRRQLCLAVLLVLVPGHSVAFLLSIVVVFGALLTTPSATSAWTSRSVSHSCSPYLSNHANTSVVKKLSDKFLEIQRRRRDKAREAAIAQHRADELMKDVSILQSEEAELRERARFLSEREDELLDAFDHAEARGGGELSVDKGLDVVVPNSEHVLDEWLQFTFDSSEIPSTPFGSS